MNPVKNISAKILSLLYRTINSFDNRTINTIKQLFFMFIFIMVLIGIYVGYRMGKSSAQIKTPPLAEYTKDIFRNDINREREEGRFGSLLESELINESKYLENSKIRFPSRENLRPEIDAALMEPEKEQKIKPEPQMKADLKPYEGKYRELKKPDSEVRPLERDFNVIKKSSYPDNKKNKPRENEKINPLKSANKEKTLKPVMKQRGIIEP